MSREPAVIPPVPRDIVATSLAAELILGGVEHGPRDGDVLETNVALGDHPGHHLHRKAPGADRGVIAIKLAGHLAVHVQYAEAPQPFVVLIEEGAGGDDVALLDQARLMRQMGVLYPAGGLLRQLRRVGRPDQQYDRVVVESHPHSLNGLPSNYGATSIPGGG